MDGRRQGRHRTGLRRGRGDGSPAPRQPPPHPERHGGPRRHRLVQPGHRRVHGLDVQPDAAHPAAPADGLRDRHPGAQGPHDLAGRRRCLRLEDLLLRRHGPRHVREQADRRAAREVGRGPARELPGHHPRPRPRHVRGGGRQARRRGHRPARQDLRQPRRPPLDDRPGHPDDALRPRPVRVLQDPERLLRGHRRLHEHHVRGRVPRRRPARGDLRRRAGDGPVRQRDRDGPGGDPAQELHSAGRLPVRQPVRPAHRERWRQDLCRLGQLRAGAEQGARGGRLRPARGEEGRGEVARQAPRHGPLHVHRGVRRRALEVDRRGRRGLGRGDVGIGQHPGPPHRQDRRHDGHPVARPGPRDDLLPDRGPGARHPDGGHRRPAFGHAGHAVRLRHVRQPDLERGQHRGDQGRGARSGTRPGAMRPTCSKPRPTTSRSSAPSTASRARPTR